MTAANLFYGTGIPACILVLDKEGAVGRKGNTHITQTYWQVGRQIVEFEQGGKARAEYGKALISKQAGDLSLRHGKGFSRTNLVYMRLLYQR